MAKAPKASFFCSACGHEAARWFGRCPACGAWNTAAEAPAAAAGGKRGAEAGAARASRARWAPGTAPRVPRPLADVEIASAPRQSSGIGELDRVLGGGWMPGSLMLVGGDPGIGKSTLMLQFAIAVARGGPMGASAPAPPRRVLYVTGEESEEQVRLRAARLGALPADLLIFCETDLDAVLEAASASAPAVMVVDSIQTLSHAGLEGGPGSVSQVRECALALLHYAKGSGAAVFLVGHVTKDGAVAGPRVLEHMVDAVLYLEGERYQHYRVLRAAKNRFGATHELGVFEMTGAGMTEVANPSAAFLTESERAEPGSAVVASLEGSRPLLVEVQALVSSSFYGTPQRVTSGYDSRRLAVLLAVLERRAGLRLGRHDVFITATGGITLDEPGTDLGVALAIASSFRSRPLLPRTVAIGEISLSGELRRVPRVDARVREAAQVGFLRAGIPRAQAGEATASGLEIVPLATLREAIDALLGEKIETRAPERDESRTRAGTPAGAEGRAGAVLSGEPRGSRS
ncbi:MAG TPA: DNA repair protein RadA [Candidatus Udaeobacter sp.]|jgi:DNA repair protein RadA/Sms|nr:DNA repair protein RadA [Candidatus Udaeobacter sp.]